MYIHRWLSCDHTGLATPPPEVPPPEILDRLTLDGSVRLEYYYVDDSNKGKGSISFYYFTCECIYTHTCSAMYSATCTCTCNIVHLYAGTHYKFSYEDIDALISQARQFVKKALSMPLPHAPVIVSSSVTWLTQLTDIWLVHALDKYPVAGQMVVSEITSCEVPL